MISVVILISGRGTNMLAIVRAAQMGSLPIKIAAVVSDRADAAGLVSARQLGIATAVIPKDKYADRISYDRALADTIRSYEPDLVVLAGFMRILSAKFVHEFAGRLLNIHPSLLPSHRGLHTHRRVLEAGEKSHGCSVHFVTEDLDAGPVVVQGRVDVRPEDTPETLSARVQVQEHRIYPQAIAWFAAGRLQLIDGEARLDGEPLSHPVMLEESA